MIKTKWFKNKHYAELYYGGSEYVSKEIIEDYDKEIEKLNKRAKECEEAYLRTRQQYSELENKYLTDEFIINELEKYANRRIDELKEQENKLNIKLTSELN